MAREVAQLFALGYAGRAAGCAAGIRAQLATQVPAGLRPRTS
ncbi:MAG: hypothetical protein ACLPKI_29545 [Streptosporangiaceae bacterium]